MELPTVKYAPVYPVLPQNAVGEDRSLRAHGRTIVRSRYLVGCASIVGSVFDFAGCYACRYIGYTRLKSTPDKSKPDLGAVDTACHENKRMDGVQRQGAQQ